MHGCNKIKIKLPTEDNNILKFQNYKHKLKVPYVIYADFEAILKPIDICLPSSMNSFTENITKHEPSSFAYYIKCSYDDSKSKFDLYRGEDCGRVFIEKIRSDLLDIRKDLNKIRKMIITNEQEINYQKATLCHICCSEFDDKTNFKVRDHCHLTGLFRGAAHKNCNINYKNPNFIPIVFHNLSGYDAHFIIKELGFDTETIDLIPQNKERYISFTKHLKFSDDDIGKIGGKVHEEEEEDEEEDEEKTDDTQYNVIKLRFIDSFRFMPSSIDKLSSNLTDSQFNEVRKLYNNEDRFNLIRKKGVYPYDYTDSHEKFTEKKLPSKKCFFNKLYNCHITDEQYNHALNVWKTFECHNLGEYSDLYLKSDVLILADIFENFRDVCLKTYDLDPAHYYTVPGLSWDAMLKYTKIELQLLTDIDMINFIMKGIRGGLSQCSKRYAKANHKYMKQYNKDLESEFLIYLDANNLYGWAMSQNLPYANFRWLSREEIDNFNLAENIGCILEVDLEYPRDLHDLHNDLPFCFQNLNPPGSKQKKLLATLTDKQNYITHLTNLKQCLSKGLKLTKIHRVLKFDQKPWLKSYIDLNTQLRSQAKNSVEKDFYKLMNNSVFGKTMEDVMKRKDIKLITHWEDIKNKFGADRYISKVNFHSRSVFSENLVAIQMNRLQITLNKPVYVGFSVLELAKTLMYDFLYNYIKPKYNENVELLYTDTDSFIYNIKTLDFYDDIQNDIEQKFDTSDFDIDNIYSIPLKNKKVLGMMKMECCNQTITEFIGLRAKSYCMLMEDDIVKKIKGIKTYVVKNNINFDDFKNCLNKNENIIVSQQNFKSIKHEIYTQLSCKLALSNNDDKRFIIPNTHKTLAWGHAKITDVV